MNPYPGVYCHAGAKGLMTIHSGPGTSAARLRGAAASLFSAAMGMPETRATLLLRIRDPEDDSAWYEFVEIYTPLVYQLAVRRGLQPADARDVLQIVLQNIFRAIRNFDYQREKGTFRSWLYTITRREISRFFRKESRSPLAAAGRTDADEEPATGEESGRWELDYRLRLFEWAMTKVEPEFAPRNWQAFVRTAIHEEDPAAVGEALGMSRAAVYVSRSRVIARIRECIAGVAEDEGDVFPGPRADFLSDPAGSGLSPG